MNSQNAIIYVPFAPPAQIVLCLERLTDFCPFLLLHNELGVDGRAFCRNVAEVSYFGATLTNQNMRSDVFYSCGNSGCDVGYDAVSYTCLTSFRRNELPPLQGSRFVQNVGNLLQLHTKPRSRRISYYFDLLLMSQSRLTLPHFVRNGLPTYLPVSLYFFRHF